MATGFDLDAYLARIGCPRPVGTDLATLRRIQRAHLQAIPFENLDIQMGLPIRIDSTSVQADLVGRARGGYCFQQNALLRLALTAIGFAPRACEGRVRAEASSVRPRTHMVLIVPLEGGEWLADVGFGATGIAEPLLIGGPPAEHDGTIYRTVSEGALHVLQQAHVDRWEDLYAFSPEPVLDIDYEVGNWYTSTHPESRFVRTLTAQRMIGRTRHLLRNLTYSTGEGGQWTSRNIARSEVAPLLRETFGLDIPDSARFHALDQAPPDRGDNEY
jgi:N-hydroxyarylamine O-acetyltransferase